VIPRPFNVRIVPQGIPPWRFSGSHERGEGSSVHRTAGYHRPLRPSRRLGQRQEPTKPIYGMGALLRIMDLPPCGRPLPPPPPWESIGGVTPGRRHQTQRVGPMAGRRDWDGSAAGTLQKTHRSPSPASIQGFEEVESDTRLVTSMPPPVEGVAGLSRSCCSVFTAETQLVSGPSCRRHLTEWTADGGGHITW